MTLYIDTTDFNRATFAVSDGKKVQKKTYKIDSHKSHETLQKLHEFLHKSKISRLYLPSARADGGQVNPKSEIKKIVINKGPGSYTGVRVGVTHALALGFAWNIKVVALGAADYSRMITRKKR
jgi:tRNA A37 threonylcarbamoyladenosine modification protein TsaB